jgi:hypothetical protein
MAKIPPQNTAPMVPSINIFIALPREFFEEPRFFSGNIRGFNNVMTSCIVLVPGLWFLALVLCFFRQASRGTEIFYLFFLVLDNCGMEMFV